MDINAHPPFFRKPLLSSLLPIRLFNQNFGDHLAESELLPGASAVSGFFLRSSVLRNPSWLENQLSEATMASSPIKSDENRRKRKKELENDTSENLQMPSEEMDFSLFESSKSVHNTEVLGEILNDTKKEINVLCTQYAQVFSERAAMHASYVEELDEILKEAKSNEYNLELKREKLRQRFATIARHLQNENVLADK